MGGVRKTIDFWRAKKSGFAGMGRKGIFFTFIAITIMAVFIIIFTPQSGVSLQKNSQALKTRIGSVDGYVSDLESSYFETVLRATTFKAVLSLIFYVNSTGSYLTDFDSAFSEVMVTGRINGLPIDSITGKKIMENVAKECHLNLKWFGREISMGKSAKVLVDMIHKL